MIPHMTPSLDPGEESEAEGQSVDHLPFGESLQPHTRGDGKTRILHMNINHFPRTQTHPGNEAFRRFIDDTGADITTLVEMNVNWKKVVAKDKLDCRTIDWWDNSRWSYGYNVHADSSSTHLYGGTAVLTISDTTARIWTNNLSDPTGLGRWTGTRYRGKGQRTLSVISAYRPQKDTGPSTVAGQHATYFSTDAYRKRTQKRTQNQSDTPDDEDTENERLRRKEQDPQKRFLLDLVHFLQQLQDQGDLLIVNMDANEDLSHPTSKVQTAMYELGLEHPMYENFHPSLPNTCKRGSAPIDGMFVTEGLRPSAMGYFSFDEFPSSDHRVLWLDFDNTELFGNRIPNIITPAARRLKLEDPAVVERFVSHYTAYLKKTKLPDQLKALRSNIPHLTIDEIEKEYDRLDRIRVKGILQAEKLCRKLKMGALYWTPELAEIHTSLNYWNKAVKRTQGRKIDTRHLNRLALAAGAPQYASLTKEQIHEGLYLTRKRYRQYKKVHVESRSKFREALAARYEEMGKGKAKSMVKTLTHKETTRANNRMINAHTKTTTKRPLTRIIGPDLQQPSSRTEYTSPNDIEQVGLNEAKSRFSQGQHTTGMDPLLIDTLGRYGEKEATTQILHGQLPQAFISLPEDSPNRKFLPYFARPSTVAPQEWKY